MIKLLFINHNMHYGGAQRVLINLLRELCRKKEYAITLYLMEYEGVFLKEVPPGVELKYLSYSMDKIKREKKYGKLPKKLFVASLRRFLGEDAFSILFQKCVLKDEYPVQIAVKEGISKVILAHCREKTCKKIFWVHTDLRKFQGDQSKDGFYYGRGNKVICVSHQVKEGFIEKHPRLANKVEVVNNIVDRQDILKKSCEGEDPYGHEELNIVNLGRLSKEKAQDRLIKAHKELLDKGYGHHLHIIGDGEEKSNLQALVKELRVEHTVTLWGAQRNPYPFLKYGDVYIHSSVNEGLPTALYEAICLNLPIASTEVSGVREVLEGGKYGLIMDNTYQGLLGGYEEMLKDENLRNQLRTSTESYQDKNEENVNKFIKTVFEEKM